MLKNSKKEVAKPQTHDQTVNPNDICTSNQNQMGLFPFLVAACHTTLEK